MLKVVVLLSVLACATAANVIVLVGAGTRDNLNNGFPQHTKIDAGDCVVWQNKGKGVHAVKAADGSFESAMLFVNDEFKHCFAEEGAFEIIDPLHAHNANMDAKSVVLVGSAAGKKLFIIVYNIKKKGVKSFNPRLLSVRVINDYIHPHNYIGRK